MPEDEYTGTRVFTAYESSVEVNGQTVASIVKAFPSALQDRARTILAENGIEEPEDGEWYSQQAWLDAFEELHETFGDSTLEQVGKAIPKNAEWPPNVNSIIGGVESIDTAYHMNHRGGEIGNYDAEQVSDTLIRVHCDNPYPCPFDIGIIKSVSQEFSDGERPRVREIGDGCRMDGDGKCIYEVEW